MYIHPIWSLCTHLLVFSVIRLEVFSGDMFYILTLCVDLCSKLVARILAKCKQGITL